MFEMELERIVPETGAGRAMLTHGKLSLPTFQVSHLDSRRQYRIEGLRPQPASQEEFELNGSMITVAQYFFER